MGKSPFSLAEKKVFVTGASSGIGRAIAVACSQMGAQVFISGRNETRLKETLSLMDKSEKHSILPCDITSQSEIKNVVNQLPSLDGIVHCAGKGQRVLCKQMTEQDVDDLMNVNFKAPVLLQAEVLKQKKMSKGGSIVFVASVASVSPSAGNAIYSASKGAIISYANCLGLELAPRQIRVNAISPAMVWTDLIYSGGISKEQLEEDEKKYPLKRYGKPEDIANLAVYLLSDASSWMTMNNVPITGGGK